MRPTRHNMSSRKRDWNFSYTPAEIEKVIKGLFPLFRNYFPTFSIEQNFSMVVPRVEFLFFSPGMESNWKEENPIFIALIKHLVFTPRSISSLNPKSKGREKNSFYLESGHKSRHHVTRKCFLGTPIFQLISPLLPDSLPPPLRRSGFWN